MDKDKQGQPMLQNSQQDANLTITTTADFDDNSNNKSPDFEEPIIPIIDIVDEVISSCCIYEEEAEEIPPLVDIEESISGSANLALEHVHDEITIVNQEEEENPTNAERTETTDTMTIVEEDDEQSSLEDSEDEQTIVPKPKVPIVEVLDDRNINKDVIISSQLELDVSSTADSEKTYLNANANDTIIVDNRVGTIEGVVQNEQKVNEGQLVCGSVTTGEEAEATEIEVTTCEEAEATGIEVTTCEEAEATGIEVTTGEETAANTYEKSNEMEVTTEEKLPEVDMYTANSQSPLEEPHTARSLKINDSPVKVVVLERTEITKEKEDTIMDSNSELAEVQNSSKIDVSPNKTQTILVVYGLSSLTRASDIKRLFRSHAKIYGVKLIEANSKRLAHVIVGSTEEASICVESFHNTNLHGNVISVSIVNGKTFEYVRPPRDATEPRSAQPASKDLVKTRAPEKAHFVQSGTRPKVGRTHGQGQGTEIVLDVALQRKYFDKKPLKHTEYQGNKVRTHQTEGRELYSNQYRNSSVRAEKESPVSRYPISGLSSNRHHFAHRGGGTRGIHIHGTRGREHELVPEHAVFERAQFHREESKRREYERRREHKNRQREDQQLMAMESRNKIELRELAREKERLRYEREKIEKEKAELLHLEKVRQRHERERIEEEKINLRNAQLKLNLKRERELAKDHKFNCHVAPEPKKPYISHRVVPPSHSMAIESSDFPRRPEREVVLGRRDETHRWFDRDRLGPKLEFIEDKRAVPGGRSHGKSTDPHSSLREHGNVRAVTYASAPYEGYSQGGPEFSAYVRQDRSHTSPSSVPEAWRPSNQRSTHGFVDEKADWERQVRGADLYNLSERHVYSSDNSQLEDWTTSNNFCAFNKSHHSNSNNQQHVYNLHSQPSGNGVYTDKNFYNPPESNRRYFHSNK